MEHPLESIAESRDDVDVLRTVETLINEFKEELGILHEKKEIITKQREADSLLSSANQMWKARSSYKYQFKNDLEIRTNHIEDMKQRAKESIIEAEAVNHSLAVAASSSVGGAYSAAAAAGDGGVTKNEDQKLLDLRVTELQEVYYAVNDIFNTIGCLIDEILVDFDDYIQNAAIYEQAKTKIEGKLKSLELEYFPPHDPSSVADSGSSHRGSNASSNSGIATNATSPTIRYNRQTRDSPTTESGQHQFVLHSSESQPSCLPMLGELSVEELEVERVKVRHVIAIIFDEDSHAQLQDLKLILEEVDLSSDSVRVEIEGLIGSFERELSAAHCRAEEIESVLDFKILERTLDNSVKPPWRRAINSETGLPIYINNTTNSSPQISPQHPKFAKIRARLVHSSSEVKFPNYRVGKKATYLQYMLLGNYWQSWDAFIPRQSYAQLVNLPDFLPLIRTLYESIDPKLVSRGKIAEAMDCFYNLLIQMAEPEVKLTGRSAQFAVIILSSASFADKMAELFRLFETLTIFDGFDQEPMIQTTDFKIMLEKILNFAKFLDEESFEIMEQSLFEEFGDFDSVWVTQTQFFQWANTRPLIIDWIRCHDEFLNSKPSEVKHQAKCNQCTVYPIEGILFNCQKCANFHLCDTCYLAKAYHHDDTHDFFSLTEPLAGNKKGFLQFPLFRRRSGKKGRGKRENSSGNSDSFTLERRNTTSTSSFKRKTSTGSRKGSPGPTNSNSNNKNRDAKSSSNSYCSLLDKEQIERRRAGRVENHYNSLKLPPPPAPRSMVESPLAGRPEPQMGEGNQEAQSDSNSYAYVECTVPVPQGSTEVMRGRSERGDGEHNAINELVRKLSDTKENKEHQGVESVASRNKVGDIDDKAVSEKVSELEDMFSNLFSHVKTISQTAGIPLIETTNTNSPKHPADNNPTQGESYQLDDIQYDSIVSLKFGRETDQIVVHVSEALEPIENHERLRTVAKCTLIGPFAVQLDYPVKSFVTQSFELGEDNSSQEISSRKTSSLSSSQSKSESQLKETESEEEHVQLTDVPESRKKEERNISIIADYCSDLVDKCFQEANIFVN